jgi:hypothetical protein
MWHTADEEKGDVFDLTNCGRLNICAVLVFDNQQVYIPSLAADARGLITVLI